jgi:hypothetical protein
MQIHICIFIASQFLFHTASIATNGHHFASCVYAELRSDHLPEQMSTRWVGAQFNHFEQPLFIYLSGNKIILNE